MITEVLDGLIKLLGPIATISKDRRELKDSSLRSISTALDETYLYYRNLDKDKVRNTEKEAQLVKYWSAAAISLRHFDPELALICDLKSEYWINPENYNDNQIDDLGIKLENVRGAYRKMLNPISKFAKFRK